MFCLLPKVPGSAHWRNVTNSLLPLAFLVRHLHLGHFLHFYHLPISQRLSCLTSAACCSPLPPTYRPDQPPCQSARSNVVPSVEVQKPRSAQRTRLSRPSKPIMFPRVNRRSKIQIRRTIPTKPIRKLPLPRRNNEHGTCF